MYWKLAEEQKEEAKRFGELIVGLGYEWFEKFKKENTWRSKLLLNWCRISKEFPEINEKRQEFVEIDKALKEKDYENKIKWKMSSWKAKFIEEHLIDQYSESKVKYRIFKEFSISVRGNDDEVLVIWIPFIATWFYWTKFWQSIEIKKSLNPTYFERILTNIPRYNWTDEIDSNSPKFNKSAF